MEVNLLDNQAYQRDSFLRAILESSSRQKIIVAGPGTGKTYTFGQLLREGTPGDKLALTFIRRLVADMADEFGDIAEVKTFHAYSKKLLHERFGGIELAPYLNSVVSQDAAAFDYPPTNFRGPFQRLEEGRWEIGFFLARGDYYRAVSFDDSVYRVYRAVRDGQMELPAYSQIVIDEYQDFNLLEVSFIEMLRENSPTLVVGDDDQAVYRLRNSSPQFLRERYLSHNVQSFELPFCSRCPQCVVKATVNFINSSQDLGAFRGRIPRRFVPYLVGKEDLNARYPTVTNAQTTNVACLQNLIAQLITEIPEEEIIDSHTSGYPSALIIGQRQYLNPISKYLESRFPDVSFSQGSDPDYSLNDAYELLLKDEASNLGWRLLAGCVMTNAQLIEVIRRSSEGALMRDLLGTDLVSRHHTILNELRNDYENLNFEIIQSELGDCADSVIEYFFPGEPEDVPEPDLKQPSILLSSFQGSKGLSAGHVFIVGVNQGEMPSLSPDGQIDDIEFSKFIVAMTRAKSKLYIFANRWYFKPKPPAKTPSSFISMIPQNLVADYGYIKSADISRVVNGVFRTRNHVS